MIGELNDLFFCYIVITNCEEGWARQNSSVTFIPGSATIYIVTALNLQEVGRLAFTPQQRVRIPSYHGSGGSVGSPSTSSASFLKGVTALYRSTNIHGSSKGRAYVSIPIYCCSSNLYFICLIMLFDDPFVIMVYILYFISFFVHYTILISIICIFYIILLNILLFI